MKLSQMFPSKYASAADLNGKPATLTISKIVQDTVNRQNGPEKVFVVYFRYIQDGVPKDTQKGVILSRRLAEQIAEAVGADDTENWKGKAVELYPTTVSAFGKDHLVFGARKAAQPAASGKPAEQTKAPEGFSDHEDIGEDLPY